jgi:hypothetical protein
MCPPSQNRKQAIDDALQGVEASDFEIALDTHVLN